MKTLLLVTALIAAFALPGVAPARAQAPNDISSKIAQGKAYSDSGRLHRRQARAMRRHHGATAQPAPVSSTDQLNQQQLDHAKS